MKKKAIEKMPIRLAIEPTKTEFTVDALIWENHLVMDVYRMDYSGNRVPKVRVVLTEKEYGSFDLEKKRWNQKTAQTIFNELQSKYYTDLYNLEAEWTEGTKEAIRNFTGTDYRSPLAAIERAEREIKEDKEVAAAERKKKRIDQLISRLPDPGKEVMEWINDHTYRNDHIFYLENNWCSRCGKNVELTEKHKHNEIGICPKCQKTVKFQKGSRIVETRKEVVLIQPHEDGLAMRYFKTLLECKPDKKEYWECTESVRTYHGYHLWQYRQKYMHYYSGISGKTFWHDKNAYGCTIAYGCNTCLYGRNMEEVRMLLPELERLPLERLAEDGIKLPVIRMFRKKDEDRVLEMLLKHRLYKLAKEYLRYSSRVLDLIDEGNTVKQIFGISKTKLQFLRERNGGMGMLKMLQDAEATENGLSEDKIFTLVKTGINPGELYNMAEKKKVMKLYNYLKKQDSYKNLKERYTHYRDYYETAAALHYDLSRDTIRYPKDLADKHDKAIMENNARMAEEYIIKKMEEFPEIEKQYEELIKRYAFEDDQIIIRPAKDAREIIQEGRFLHHCVGRDGYLNEHNKGKAFILFARKKDCPDTPWYTIEYDGTRAVQYYGAYDKKPEKKVIDMFLNKWKAYISRNMKQEEKAG